MPFASAMPFNYNGALEMNIRTITSDAALLSYDYVILANATGGAITITLPSAAGCNGRVYVIKKIDSSTNAITVDGNGAETIDGAATLSILAPMDSFTIQSNGTAWYIIEAHIANTCIVNSDSYTGDGNVNRAVAHGLGKVPLKIDIYSAAGTCVVTIYRDGKIKSRVSAAAVANVCQALSVTAMDNTNFYVGTAGLTPYSGNDNAVTYIWVGIG